MTLGTDVGDSRTMAILAVIVMELGVLPENRKGAHRVHEVEGYPDEVIEEEEDELEDEPEEIFLQEGQDEEDSEPDKDESDEEELERLEEAQLAFVSGWRATQKTAALRQKRGFVPPTPRSSDGKQERTNSTKNQGDTEPPKK